MMTKDDKVMCDSCHKEIKDEVTVVKTNGKGWANRFKSENHFHRTPLDCANAVEPIKIQSRYAMHANERKRRNG